MGHKSSGSPSVRKSLHYSILDGVFASIMLGINETFMTPYALFMKASAGMIGILSSMPNLAGALLQMKSAVLTERFGSRKALIKISILIHALMLVPVILIPYIFKTNQALFLIIFYTICIAFNGIAFPAWSSMMSDLVAENERGRYFGRRNMLTGIIYVISMLAGGVILYFMSTGHAEDRRIVCGFSVIFLIAFLSRLISWHYLNKMHEPPFAIRDEHRFTMLDFLKRVGKSNFGRFVFFIAAINFTVFLVSPFFAVYMLNDLKFNYMTFAIVTVASQLTMFVSMNLWGLHADHVGNRRIMKITSAFIPCVPLLWLFSHNVLYLIIIQIFSGFVWAGFNLSASNFIYDAVTSEKRTRCIAYFNVINGLAVFFGATTGGYLLKILPALFGYKMLTLVLISGGLRIFAALLCSYVREVRKVREITDRELFYSIIGLKPLLGLYDNKE